MEIVVLLVVIAILFFIGKNYKTEEFKNINKTNKVRKLEKILKRRQRSLSRKLKRKEVKTKHSCTENKLRCCGIVIHTNRRKQFEKCTR